MRISHNLTILPQFLRVPYAAHVLENYAMHGLALGLCCGVHNVNVMLVMDDRNNNKRITCEGSVALSSQARAKGGCFNV